MQALPALAALLLAFLLSGCSSAPLAATAQPDRPSGTAIRPDAFHETAATMTVTAVGPRDLSDCLYVDTEDDGFPAVENGSIQLKWASLGASSQALHVSATIGAQGASAEGTSPLWLNWTAADGGPALLPFLIHAWPAGDVALALQQEVTVHVRLGTSAIIDDALGPCPS